MCAVRCHGLPERRMSPILTTFVCSPDPTRAAREVTGRSILDCLANLCKAWPQQIDSAGSWCMCLGGEGEGHMTIATARIVHASLHLPRQGTQHVPVHKCAAHRCNLLRCACIETDISLSVSHVCVADLASSQNVQAARGRSALRPALPEAMPEPASLRRPSFSKWWRSTFPSCYAQTWRMLKWEAAHAALLFKSHTPQCLPSTMPSDKLQRLGEAEHPGPSQPGSLDLQEKTFTIVNHDASEANLNRSEVGSRGLWRFQAPPLDGKRRVSSDCKTPQGALMSWLRLHGESLDQNSKLQLEEACTQYRPSRPEAVRAPLAPATTETQGADHSQALMDEDVRNADTQEPIDSSTTRQVPDAQQLRWFEQLPTHEILGDVRPAQAKLPKASTDMICAAIMWLMQLTENEDALLAEFALTLLITAPRWLWPMPPKPPGRQHRRPYARQQAIRCRIQQLYGGKWRQLLVPQEAEDAPVVTDEQTKDKDPDQTLAAALRVSRSRGKLSKSWKRLQGHGLLPPGEATNTLLTAKWAAQPNAPLPSDHNRALRDCEDLWTPALVDAAVASLKAGTAADAAGWTSEAIQVLHGNLPAAQLVSTLLRKLTESHPLSRPWQILCTSSLIPLKKSHQGGVRPIAVPSAWHKLASSITATQCLPESLPVFEGMQYGIGTPNGCVKLTKGVQQYMQQHPEAVIAQWDLSNAFGSLGRPAALESLYVLHKQRTKYSAKWLQSPHFGCVASAPHERKLIPTTSGLPQGDPMSAMIFCMSITMALQRELSRQEANDDQLMAASPPRAWIYVDDITIACARGDLLTILEAIKDELKTIGLVLNDDKTQVYMSTWGEIPAQQDFQRLWAQHGSTEGIILCGHPLDLQEAPSHPQCPLGSSDFVDQWLKKRAKSQDQMVDTVLKATKEDLRRGGAAGAAPLLQAEHIRIQKDLLAADGWTDPLRSLTTDSTSSSHIRLAAQIFAAPVSAPPTQEMFVHDHAMEVHARWLLDLPLVPADATCANVKRGTHHRCDRPLDPTLHHVWGCAGGQVISRHHALTRMWCDLAREAGWAAQAEQDIAIMGFEDDPTAVKRVDAILTDHTARRRLIDVRTSATLRPSQAEMQTLIKQKEKNYRMQESAADAADSMLCIPVHVLLGPLSIGGTLLAMDLIRPIADRWYRMGRGTWSRCLYQAREHVVLSISNVHLLSMHKVLRQCVPNLLGRYGQMSGEGPP